MGESSQSVDTDRMADQYDGASVQTGCTGAWRSGIPLLGREFAGAVSVLSVVFGKDDRDRRYQSVCSARQRIWPRKDPWLYRGSISAGSAGICIFSVLSLRLAAAVLIFSSVCAAGMYGTITSTISGAGKKTGKYPFYNTNFRQCIAAVSGRARMSERNIFAVCDLDVDYAYHFMEYLSKKKNIPFEVRGFDD